MCSSDLVLTASAISAVTGFRGNYNVAIGRVATASNRAPGTGEEERHFTVGAIIVATGYDYYQPRDGEYGTGQHPQVITMPQFITLLKESTGETLAWQGRPIRRLGFMHCVGSRQIEGVHAPQADGKVNDYCSRVCCTTTLHHAAAAKRRFPDRKSVV